MNFIKLVQLSLLLPLLLISKISHAQSFEFSLYAGQMFSSDLIDNNGNDVDVDSGTNIAVAIGWPKNVNGQGQILLNRVSHDFENKAKTINSSVDITYAHFNGVALFRQQNYTTSFSLGLGGAHFDADIGDSELYPSLSLAVGTRYEISTNFALVTELRAYASLVDEKDDLFCQTGSCTINFDKSLWLDSNIAVGVAIKF